MCMAWRAAWSVPGIVWGLRTTIERALDRLACGPDARSAQKPVIQVIRKGVQPTVPQLGSVVTARVTKITRRLAAADILVVGDQPVSKAFSGIIRFQDVRASEVDTVSIGACFRPGDIVKAEVLSLGDSRSYYLSTARNDLGVVYARSLAGVPLVPISWQEMQCPQTKAVEKRKVAKAAP